MIRDCPKRSGVSGIGSESTVQGPRIRNIYVPYGRGSLENTNVTQHMARSEAQSDLKLKLGYMLFLGKKRLLHRK